MVISIEPFYAGIVAQIREVGPITCGLCAAVLSFLFVRVAQRLYYVLCGHVHHISFNPRKEMDLFIKKNGILFSEVSFVSKRDKVRLRYRKLGNGSKIVLLNNGVGTDLYMWLPTLEGMLRANPSLFDDITLIAPSYRGLFGSDIIPLLSGSKNITMEHSPEDFSFFTAVDNTPDVTIAMTVCVDDAVEIMEHEKIEQYHTIIGWSLGAQLALSSCAQNTKICQNLFLLNPSTGSTIHYVFQTIFPFPLSIRKFLSNSFKVAIILLIPIISTSIWDSLKFIVYSTFFRIILVFLAFFGGFPPEQPVYFHSYMKDVFHTRNQTKGLLRLIIALDSPLSGKALVLTNTTVIVSGLADVLTGVLHSWRLRQSMPNSKHIMFTMASHFLLIEWPNLLAVEIVRLLDVPCKTALKKSETRPKLIRK